LSSGKRKIKIEFEDAEGSKYNLSLDGDISKNKILKVYELMESLKTADSGSFAENKVSDANGIRKPLTRSSEGLSSVGSRIWYVVENKFPSSTFTSSDIQEMYEEEYRESMRLDAIATYLSRYVNKGKLVRNRKGGKEWAYKIVPSTKTTTFAESNRRDISQVRQIMSPDQQMNINKNSINSNDQGTSNFSTLTEVN
jgi:predicted transcriptional regulator